MINTIKIFLKKTFNYFGYDVSKIQPEIFTDLRYRDFVNCIDILEAINHKDLDSYKLFFEYIKVNKSKSVAQNFQDLFVLYMLKEKRAQQFVEFGAADGIINSNTYLLEKDFEWTGVLAEPNRAYIEKLKKNRCCNIDGRAVFSTTGDKLEFEEKLDMQLSGLSVTMDNDSEGSDRYKVDTVSLNDLLQMHEIRPKFGLLSIDVEGAEVKVLSDFDLNKWCPSIVVIEHNYRPADRNFIRDFFMSNGYSEKFQAISKCDCWFVRDEE